jgi:hypothetical protein
MPELETADGVATIIAILAMMGGFLTARSPELKLGLLLGGLVLIATVSAQCAVRLGDEFVDTIEKHG